MEFTPRASSTLPDYSDAVDDDKYDDDDDDDVGDGDDDNDDDDGDDDHDLAVGVSAKSELAWVVNSTWYLWWTRGVSGTSELARVVNSIWYICGRSG